MNEPQNIEIGQYWERIRGDSDVDVLPIGTLLIITELNDDQLLAHSGESGELEGRYFDYDEFQREYKFVPDGAIRRAHQISEINQQMLAQQMELAQKQAGLSMLPSASTEDLSGSETVTTETEGGSSLIRRVDPQSMVTARGAMNTFRNDVKKYEATLAKQRSKIEALLGEQSRAIAARLESANKMIKKLTEVVFTFDIYLGKNEVIKQIRKGSPAASSEKIVIRQLTLYMDEESTIAADVGGMDFQNMESFDEWVVVPANLQQVLPEIKGVVAIQPRRTSKHYSDNAIVDAMINTANHKTYWLIRNGENLYRICTSLDVGDHTVPYEDEYMELFESEEYKGNGKYEKVSFKPGDRKYMEAMEKADEKKRHYMRILLFLQGLIDRTPVFHPYPHGWERINVMNERYHEDYVHYVYDADPKKLLSHGRPDFSDWIESVNSHIDVGHRIMGFFGYGSKSHRSDEESSRTWPRNADNPKDMELYTIERREKEFFLFLYENTTYGYKANREWGKVPTDKRASYKVDPADMNVLAIDFADVEDMKFYLNDRLNRSGYMYIFPLLQRAIQIKEKEAAEEVPFRQLLTGMIMNAFLASREMAQESVDELVLWWKFKNRTHRSLKSDEKKVIAMILEEYQLRARKFSTRDTLPHDKIVAEILEACPTAVYIGHKVDKDYVVMVPHNEENVFVNEQTWTYYVRGVKLLDENQPVVSFTESMKLTEEKPWSVVDKRRLRWLQVYAAPRWGQWAFDVRKEKYLTDLELTAAQQVLTSSLKEKLSYYRKDIGKQYLCDRIITIVRDGDQRVILYLQGGKVRIEGVMGDEACVVADPEIYSLRLSWHRHKGSVTRDGIDVSHLSNIRRWWEPDDDRGWGKGQTNPARVLLVNEDNYKACEAEFAAYEIAKEQDGAVSNMVWDIRNQETALLNARIKAAAKAKFLAENNHDEELWAIESAKMKFDSAIEGREGISAAQWLIARGQDINGMTYREVADLARTGGWKYPPIETKKSKNRRWHTHVVENKGPDQTPWDMVIKYKIRKPDLPESEK